MAEALRNNLKVASSGPHTRSQNYLLKIDQQTCRFDDVTNR